MGLKMVKRVYNMFAFAIRVIFYASYIVFACTTIFILDWIIINKKIRRWLLKGFKETWLHLTMFTFGGYFRYPVYIQYNPRIQDLKKTIVISNHLTNYDWLFILMILQALGRYEQVCIMLKRSVANIPFIGYGMKLFGFIFLNRNISRDEGIIKNGVESLVASQKYDLLIFPEGTIITADILEKSIKFSEENGLTFKPTECLLPRTTGFNLIKETIGEDIDGVIDITLACNPYLRYPSNEQTLWNVVVEGSQKVNFSFYIDVIDKSEIYDPNFLYKTFEKKDVFIKKYKAHASDKMITSCSDFIETCHKVERPYSNYIYVEKYMGSPFSSVFVLIFVFTLTTLLTLLS